MIALCRAISAEIFKLKRTLALWMAIITPLAIIGLMFFGSLLRQNRIAGGKAWDWFPQIIFSLWGLLMLPLFVTLETALLSGLETAEKHWKHLFALPISRTALYMAKLLVGAGLIGLSTLTLWGGTLLAGYCLRWLKPGLGFDAPIPWFEMLQKALLIYLAAWLILALHTWINLRWQSFTLSVGLGMIATVVGAFVTNSEFWARFYPWTLPSVVISGDGAIVVQVLGLGILGGIVVAIVGCWDVVRQDVL